MQPLFSCRRTDRVGTRMTGTPCLNKPLNVLIVHYNFIQPDDPFPFEGWSKHWWKDEPTSAPTCFTLRALETAAHRGTDVSGFRSGHGDRHLPVRRHRRFSDRK